MNAYTFFHTANAIIAIIKTNPNKFYNARDLSRKVGESRNTVMDVIKRMGSNPNIVYKGTQVKWVGC